MEETTTPDTPEEQSPPMTDDEQGESNASGSISAPEETTQETESAEGSEGTQDSAEEDEIETWAKSQNLDLTKPEDAKKLAKRFKDTQKALHTTRKEQSDLRKQMAIVTKPAAETDDYDPVSKRLEELEADLRLQKLEGNVNRFYIENPDARKLDTQMAEILTNKPWLAGDLETLYLVARNTDQSAIDEAKGAGRQEALTSVATKVRASAPSTSAKTSDAPRQITDADVARMSLEEYQTRRDEILRSAR